MPHSDNLAIDSATFLFLYSAGLDSSQLVNNSTGWQLAVCDDHVSEARKHELPIVEFSVEDNCPDSSQLVSNSIG